jgi:hypothetical protein
LSFWVDIEFRVASTTLNPIVVFIFISSKNIKIEYLILAFSGYVFSWILLMIKLETKKSTSGIIKIENIPVKLSTTSDRCVKKLYTSQGSTPLWKYEKNRWYKRFRKAMK